MALPDAVTGKGLLQIDWANFTNTEATSVSALWPPSRALTYIGSRPQSSPAISQDGSLRTERLGLQRAQTTAGQSHPRQKFEKAKAGPPKPPDDVVEAEKPHSAVQPRSGRGTGRCCRGKVVSLVGKSILELKCKTLELAEDVQRAYEGSLGLSRCAEWTAVTPYEGA